MSLLLKRFDCLRRVPRTLSNSTMSGAVLSVLTCIFIVIILYTQISMWMSPVYKRRTVVHRDSDNKRVTLKMNITFLSAPCDKLALKIHDQFSKSTDVVSAVRSSQGSGCNLHVNHRLKRINGDFIFASTDNKTDMSHTIEDAIFGDTHQYSNTKSFHALKGVKLRNIGKSTHDYIVKLLQTTFHDEATDTEYIPYQYTFSYRPHHIHPSKDGLPVPVPYHYVRFKYNWSPLVVEYRAEYNSLYYVITNSIAYCGGLFATLQVLHRASLGGAAFIKDNMYKKL